MTDGIYGPTDYGVFGSGQGEGTTSLDVYAPGSIFTGNVLVGASADRYPPGNDFPASIDVVGFVDAASGDYRLAGGSPYAGRGADVDLVPAFR